MSIALYALAPASKAVSAGVGGGRGGGPRAVINVSILNPKSMRYHVVQSKQGKKQWSFISSVMWAADL